jgi:hypothetical protein
MNSLRTLRALIAWHSAMLCLAMTFASSFAEAESLRTTPVTIHVGDTRIVRPVVSFQELRQSKLVRQTWDSSCGAARSVQC